MEAFKQYETICTMLKYFDLHTGNRGAEAVIHNPHEWINSAHFPFYAAAAEMLIDSMEHWERKTTSAGALAALKRIINGAPDKLQGVFTRPNDNGGYYVTNGHLLIRLNKDLEALPHISDGFDITPHYNAMLAARDSELFTIPTAAQLKAFIKAEKARSKTSGNKTPRPVALREDYFVNPDALIDILTIIPDAVAHNPESYKSPLYLQGANGLAMLLPVNPSEWIKKQAAELKVA